MSGYDEGKAMFALLSIYFQIIFQIDFHGTSLVTETSCPFSHAIRLYHLLGVKGSGRRPLHLSLFDHHHPPPDHPKLALSSPNLMHAGDQKPASRPFTCASFLEASVAETSAYGLRLQDAYEKSHRPKISIDELDQDQKISACLLEEEEEDEEEPSPSSTTSATSSVHSYSYSPSPIPIQATSSDSPELSSSPAALFLSAFMSPKVEPAALPDDEGQAVGGYTLGPIVGFGGFSTIRKATSASGGVVAITG